MWYENVYVIYRLIITRLLNTTAPLPLLLKTQGAETKTLCRSTACRRRSDDAAMAIAPAAAIASDTTSDTTSDTSDTTSGASPNPF